MGEVDASFLQALEPLLGGGLALNLAYLYLQWFYYLETISKTAVDARRVGADSNEILSNGTNDPDVQCVDYLASLGKVGTSLRKSKRFPNLPWGTWWAYLLLLFFITRLDRLIAIIGTGLIMVFLVIGVAHDIGMYTDTLTNLSDKKRHVYFHLATLAFIWPVAMAILAFFIRKSVEKYVKLTVGEVAINKQETAQKKIKDAPKP